MAPRPADDDAFDPRILGDHWERGYGDLEWRGVAPERPLPWYALLHDPAQNKSCGYGVQTGAASFASWRVDETGVSLVLDVRNGGLGVHLGGRRRLAATVRELSSSPGETLETICPRVWRSGDTSDEKTYDWTAFPGTAFPCPP